MGGGVFSEIIGTKGGLSDFRLLNKIASMHIDGLPPKQGSF